MAPGRTLGKWLRIYGNGYNLSGYNRSIGALPWEFTEHDIWARTEAVHNYLLGDCSIGGFTYNGVLDSTAVVGSHTLLAAGTTLWDLMIALGIRAEPAQGDPVYCGKFPQKGYQGSEDGGAITCTAPFGVWDASDLGTYRQPWGTLVHALAAETGANTANGYDDGAGAQTTAGGFLMYQITAYGGTGSATISIDDSANNSTWLALTGATTAAIAHTSMPCAGIIELSHSATVRQYLRWQLSLSTLSSCTFALAFVRGRNV